MTHVAMESPGAYWNPVFNLRDGLLQARCLPPAGQRDGRDVTRDRTKLVQERATITLASVAMDRMGVFGRAMWAALVEAGPRRRC